MTKLRIKQRMMDVLEASWSAVWSTADKRKDLAEDLADYLSRNFRPTNNGLWTVWAAQEMQVDAPEPSMRAIYLVHRGDDEPYSSISQTEATAVAEILNVIETELRSRGNPA